MKENGRELLRSSREVGMSQTNRHGEVISLFKTSCLEGQVIFLDRATELKLSITRWKFPHFFRDNESCEESLSLFVFFGQRLIVVGCLIVMLDTLGCGQLWCFGAEYDAYC
jgi:hypothetical protein